MREFSLRSDIQRVVIDGFALPLGFVPGDIEKLPAPTPGYTVDYVVGQDDEPDTYAFYVVASHERLADLVERAFDLLPDQVYGIVEIGSRDAYRPLDVYLGEEPIPSRRFRASWRKYGSFLLEDGSIGSGANAEDPFVEVFLDQWKGLSIHVPVLMRDEVEGLLASYDLREVAETWPALDDDEANEALRVRPVLSKEDDFSPGVDEMLLRLRRAWRLQLNIDRFANRDEAGRSLGRTLWHAMVIVASRERTAIEGYASVWATAASLDEMEDLIGESLSQLPGWRFVDLYTVDRVAYDERPDDLVDLPARRTRSEVHLVVLEQ